MKRFLTLFLALCLVFSMVPANVTAVGTQPEGTQPQEPTVPESTQMPTEVPTEAPTQAPSEAPTEAATQAPTEAPTEIPTEAPTEIPTEAVTETPTLPEITVEAPVVSAPADHTHRMCSCALTGGNACGGHTDEAPVFVAWDDYTKLPNATDDNKTVYYYLTEDVVVGNTDQVKVKNGYNVTICLNGFSIKFNENKKDAQSYNVQTGGTLNIINCKAELNSKGLFVSGNKDHNTGVNAGRLFGGRDKGSIFVNGGALNVIGAEFYDNGVKGKTSGVIYAVGTVTITHSRFDSNNGNYGGVIRIANNSALTLDDTVIENTQAAGGTIYAKPSSSATVASVITIKGDSIIRNNQTTGSGSAVYMSSDSAGYAPQLVLQDNVIITGNTANSAKGAVALDHKSITVRISGNVQIYGNTSNATGTLYPNIFASAEKAVQINGALSGNAMVVLNRINRLALAPNATMADTNYTRICLEEGVQVGYSAANGFYKATDAHKHYNGACAITGETCQHTGEAEVAYQPWLSATSLPTSGNWYLLHDVQVSADGALDVSGTLNLCLNGHSIRFNSNNTAKANYTVGSGETLNIINCEASLDGNGLLNSGNAKISGGRTLNGGAFYVNGGTLNIIAVEVSDNGVQGTSLGGMAYVNNGGVLKAQHTKIDGNKSNAGGAISARIGNATIVLDDTQVTNNIGSSGGAVYIRAMKNDTVAPVLTVKGNSSFTGNTSTGSGCAIYASIEWDKTTHTGASVAPVITLQDNVSVTGNTSSTKKGAIVLDVINDTGSPEGKLAISGNVQIQNNTTIYADKKFVDVYLPTTKCKLEVGALGAATVNVNTDFVVDNLDSFMVATVDTKVAANTGITYGTTHESIGYDTTRGFYFNHDHGICDCVVTGETGCTDCKAVEWAPWTSTTKLPTKGNWYLIADLEVTSFDEVKLENGQELNLCLNGFSIKFNPEIAKDNDRTNYYLNKGSQMNIINCQAKLDENGLLLCGDKNDPANEKAGRLYGGRGLYGGAIYVKGDLTVIGVEFYDNKVISERSPAQNFGGALRVQEGGTVTAMHAKFDSNSAIINGGAIAVNEGDAEISLHDTVLTNNWVEGLSDDTTTGRGGAIYFKVNHSAAKPVTKEPVLTVSGNSLIQGNYTGELSGRQGGAIAIVNMKPNGHDLQVTICDDTQILNNTAKGTAGAIFLAQYGTDGAPKVTVRDNAKINGNESTGNNGGAFCITNATDCDKEVLLIVTDNAQINENTARYNGGAIYAVHSGTKKGVRVEIDGNAQISGNTAQTTGGAVYLKNESEAAVLIANISGNAQICENTAADGGAFGVNGTSVLNLSGNAQISGNKAGSRGGAIFVDRPSSTPAGKVPQVSVSGDVAIISNEATGNGGGIYIRNEDRVTPVYLKVAGNVQIKNNVTGNNGPNIYLWANNGEELVQKIEVGELTSAAKVYVTVNLGSINRLVTDPDLFLVRADGVSLADTSKCGIIFESVNPPVNVGYDNAKKVQFYFSSDYGAHENHAVCVCAITGDASCSHEEELQWSAWIYDNKLPSTTGNYYLTKDVVFTGTAGKTEVLDGQKVNLCLNGFSITFSEDNTAAGNYYARVGGELNIINCKAVLDKDNKFVSGNAENPDGGVISGGRGKVGGALYSETAMTLIGVALKDNKATDAEYGIGGAVRVQSGAQLTVKSCLFENNEAYLDGGAISTGADKAVLDIQDTIFTGNKAARRGGAVAVPATSNEETVKLTISGCTITNNEAQMGGGVYAVKAEFVLSSSVIGKNTATVSGGGVYINTDTVLNMSSGEIRENASAKYGGGIYITSNAVLNLSGGKITNNTTEGIGGGVCSYDGADGVQTVKMTGGEISGNKAKTGGGVYHYASEGVYTGGKITLNEAQDAGGGFYANKGASVQMNGQITISENTVTNGSGAGVVVQASTLVMDGGIIEKNTTKKYGGGIILWEGAELTINNGKIRNNSADRGGGIYANKASVINLTGGLVLGNTSVVRGGGVYLDNSLLNMSGGWISENICEGIGGGVFAYSETADELSVKHTGGDISYNKAENGAGVYHYTSAGEYTGGKITRNEANNSGGGLYAYKNSKIRMDDEFTIRYNTAAVSGGGAVVQGSEMTIDGGIIEKNNANSAGGGIVLWKEAKVILDGGKINNNTIKVSSGGGVSLSGNSTFEMKKGSIDNNYAKIQGGGLYVGGGCTFKLSGGTISNNRSGKQGGGIYAFRKESEPMTYVYMSGGTVSANKSVSYAGVYVVSSTMKMSGGSITGNVATKSGGGLSTSKVSTITMTGGVVSNNTAQIAAGVLVQGLGKGSTFNFSGGTIKGNTTTKKQGGGVYVSTDSRINMSGGTISGNTAATGGGGIYMNAGEVTISGGLIEYNKAEGSAGGGIHTSGGKMTISDVTVANNESYWCGGGIRTFKNTEFVMTGGVVTENVTAAGGGGIALFSDATISGVTISNNKVLANEKYGNPQGGGIIVYGNTSVYAESAVYELNISDCEIVGNSVDAEGQGGGMLLGMECTVRAKNVTFKDNTSGGCGGAVTVYNIRNYRTKEAYFYADDCLFTDNQAGTSGGAIFGSYTTETHVNGCSFANNTAKENGGAIYLRKNSEAWIKNSQITENTAQKAAAIYVGEDAELESLTITGNNAGDGYSVYFVDGDYDGMSYVRNLVKIGGAMKICDNNGSKADMYIGNNQVVAVNSTGLTEGTKINVELASGILTNTLIGEYDYEGGNQKYVVTCGSRSVTDPEPIPVTESPEATEPVTEPVEEGSEEKGGNATALVITGGVLVAALAVIAAILAGRKKKKATNKGSE